MDCIVIGGGPAGLSAAIYLARYDRRVVVFDAGHGRSTHHQVNHNYLGFPGGVPAVRLRELGRAQLAEYGHVTVADQPVVGCRSDDGAFVAEGPFGACQAPTIILATGVRDHYPEFPGWEGYVGRSMFWCITCDGYASKGKRVVVIGHDDNAAGEAVQLSRFTHQLTLLTNQPEAEISPPFRARLERFGIPVVHDLLGEVEGDDGRFSALTTRGGRRLELDAMFCTQGATPQVGLARSLGVRLAANGYIETDVEQRTSVPGVFAAGDVTRIHGHQVTTAVHEGATAASSANHHLYPPELKADPAP